MRRGFFFRRVITMQKQGVRNKSLKQRFQENVDKSGDCWLWTGRTHSSNGTGLIEHEMRFIAAHRFSYQQYCGPIPKGHWVQQRCAQRLCVKPTHLLLGHPMGPKRKTIAERFWSKVKKTDDCWLWCAGRNTRGYGVIGVGTAKEGMVRAHRVSWELHYGSIPDGLWVLHKCDVRACVNPEHLFLGTAQDNTNDMIRKGRDRHLCGEEQHCAVLTDDIVAKGRRAYKAGGDVTIEELATQANVSIGAMRNALIGHTWKHVKEPPTNRKPLLTAQQKEEIRQRYKPYKISQPQLAREYGVSRTYIEQIIHGGW